MTTIALPILAVAAVAMLAIMVLSLIKWDKRSAAQLSTLENIEKRLATVEKALKIRIRQSAEAASQQLQEKNKPDELQQTQQPHPEHREPEPVMERTGSANLTDDIKPGPTPDQDLQEHKPESPDNPTIPLTAEIPKAETFEDKNAADRQKENLDKGSDTPTASIYNIGKSGKIYTEEELELLIRE